MNRKFLERKFLQMIEEDSKDSDITSELVPEKTVLAKIISKDIGIVSGISELSVLFEIFNIKIIKKIKDGSKITKGKVIFKLKGNIREILLVERTALNILSRMSGISTLTREFVEKARKKNPKIRIAATRKILPLFSYFDKKAVKIGGGDTHRHGLYDMILIKDNHLKIFGNVKNALKKAKEQVSFAHKIEIEVSSVKDAILAAKNGADIIMLDNFSIVEIKKTIEILKKENLRDKVLLEASGNITLENVEDFASTGVDILSIGMLTHSVKALDMSLEIYKICKKVKDDCSA
ncbi:MAG: carboxylating nicotinate-nucleotide diphosphorylase [Candidatus Altiarchaeota archaeon]